MKNFKNERTNLWQNVFINSQRVELFIKVTHTRYVHKILYYIIYIYIYKIMHIFFSMLSNWHIIFCDAFKCIISWLLTYQSI